MKPYNFSTILVVICFFLCFQFKGFTQETTVSAPQKKDSIVKRSEVLKKEKIIEFSGLDGPYIINDTLYRVNKDSKLMVTPFFNRDSVQVFTDNIAVDTFNIALKSKYKTPKTVYRLPEKMIVISDIEGNFNAFSGFLLANQVIDKNHNWIYGNGHLVLVGDFVDRGKNVTQVLWLIYKLEQQAKAQNGVVHYILGNHEILNFYGDHRYNRGKYIKAAQEISRLEDKKEALKYLYSENSELGKWLATKNVIEKIGPYLFVHGGLSPESLAFKLDLAEINTLSRIRYTVKKASENKAVNFFYSSKGPLWYRGLVMTTEKYPKINATDFQAILDHYKAKKIVIGHTPVKAVSTDFNGKLIRIDVRHGYLKFSGQTKGLLIENGQEFIISDDTTKTLLKH